MVFNFDSNGITFQNKGGAIINNENITVTSNGTYTAGEGYTGLGTVDVNVADIPAVTEELNVTPTTSAQTIRPEEGKDGFNPVNVAAVTSSIDANITAGNIKKDVTILGVTGSYEGSGSATLITKSITQNGTYNASSDNADGYSSVTVNVSGGGGGVGITREVSANGVYQMPANSFTFSLPSNATDISTSAMQYAFQNCTSLTSVDLSSLTTVSSNYAFNNAFNGCTGLTSVDLSSLTTVTGGYSLYNAFRGCTSLTNLDLSSLTTLSGVDGNNSLQFIFYGCTSLTSVDLSSLTTVSSASAFINAFNGCTGLTSVDLSSLTTVSGHACFSRIFSGCTSLTTLSFPALTSTSFGSETTQFNNMLQGVTGCTVHFPSNLQSVIGSWSDVTAGFGGTNTTVLFDLTATT